MRDACAIRGLALKAPVQVRPMSAFTGGYTAGIGNVTWGEHHATDWRDGWCALGVYCTKPSDPAAKPVGAENPAERGAESRLSSPAGLYDGERHTLFVRSVAGDTPHATVAHEATHALQHHNFPALNAAHLWHNRDLAAGASAAQEGDAHIVGWSFDAQRRLFLCSIDPRHAHGSHARWWGWRADNLWAHEGFGHVFGPELALARQLAQGNTGVDALLREPPLSTLAVLAPERAGPVEFIALPQQLAAAASCRIGLRNTAGVVGIWGLLLRHDDDQTAAPVLPNFLNDWLGDRFAHVACPDDGDDGLVWLTRWRTAAAAREFADRYQRIAASVRVRDGMLAGEPRAIVRGRSVVVTTPELGDVVADVAESPIKAFSSYSAWVASGCYPHDCGEMSSVEMSPAGQHVCSVPGQPPVAFGRWLDRVRRARHAVAAMGDGFVPGLEGVAQDAKALAAFCAVNVPNTDIRRACAAATGGGRYMAGVLADPAWRLLPYCASDRELRQWVVRNYHAASERPVTSGGLFANVHGPSLAARALRVGGVAGLKRVLAAPPLSTLHVLVADHDEPVEMLRLPHHQLAARGCRVAASDVRGALAVWDLLVAHGRVAGDASMPHWLGDWRGDRLAFMHCDPGGTGWLWVVRWRTESAARDFAAHYRAMAVADESLLPAAAPVRQGRTVWIVPADLRPMQPLLAEHLTARAFASFAEWVAGGCFPQQGCTGTDDAIRRYATPAPEL